MPTDNQKNHFCTASSGFTLIEVMIAIAIFSIGILAVAGMQLWNVKNNTTGNITTLATLLARDQMEQLKNVSDVTTLASGADPNNPIDENGQNVVATKATEGYFRSWNIADNTPTANMKTISVRVQWSEKKDFSITIDTVISEG